MKTKVVRNNGSIFDDGFTTAVVVSKSGGWSTVQCRDGREFKYRNGQLAEVPWDTPDAAPDIESVPKALRKLVPAPVPPPEKPAPKTKFKIGAQVVDKVRYATTSDIKTESGRVSVDNDDQIAQLLRGCDLVVVYRKAAEILEAPQVVLEAQYAHLNPGMQRMNLGNRIRKALRK